MTTSARVRWLDGTIKQVELEGTGASIASLRVAVAALSGLAAVPPPTRKSCKLYLRGVELRDDSAPLRISPGETVACVVRAESKKDRSRRRSREAEGGEKAGVEETGARPARPPPPRPPRPPPPRPPRPPLARPPSPPPPAPEGGEPEEPAPSPLPPALRSLAAAFRTLLAAYDFVSRRQLRATPDLLASVAAPLALASAPSSFSSSSSRGGGGGVDAAAAVVDGASIRACASLCPEMISLRGGGGGEKRRPIASKPPPSSPTTALLSSVVAAAPPCASPNDDGEGQRAREALDEGSPFLEVSKIRTRGAAASASFLGFAGGEAAAAVAPPPPRTRVAVFRAALLRAAAVAAAAGLPRDAPLEGFVCAFEEASRRAKSTEEEEQQKQQDKQRGERRKRGQTAAGGGAAAAAAAEEEGGGPSSSTTLASLLRADDARHQLSVADFVEQRLAGAPWYSGQIEHGRTLRPRAARFLRVPRESGDGGGGGGGGGEAGGSAEQMPAPAAVPSNILPWVAVEEIQAAEQRTWLKAEAP